MSWSIGRWLVTILGYAFAMKHVPRFPDTRAVDIKDRDMIQAALDRYRPETSELTFSNVFIWRAHYGLRWSVFQDWLLFFCTNGDNEDEGDQTDAAICQVLPPIGPPSRTDVVLRLLRHLRDDRGISNPTIERADKRLVEEIGSCAELSIEPQRAHFDYLYETRDLIDLAGQKYHAKRNHIAQARRAGRFTYEPLSESRRHECLELTDRWCKVRHCTEDLGLMGEQTAIHEALAHLTALKLHGGIILIEGRVGAFALGELLNPETGVVHIEKASPDHSGLFAMINQSFCAHAFAATTYVNREQDLGEKGLRRAKLSYHPIRLVEKYRIQLT
jgi:hypothetical protein